MHFDVGAMRRAASDPALQATDVAEHLVANGVPFREAHTIVGALVAETVDAGRTLADLDLGEWRAASDHFDPERRRSLRSRRSAAPPRRSGRTRTKVGGQAAHPCTGAGGAHAKSRRGRLATDILRA